LVYPCIKGVASRSENATANSKLSSCCCCCTAYLARTPPWRKVLSS
jgi:hypothetical protein